MRRQYHIKDLSIKLNRAISWQYHVNNLRANAILFKIRKYVSLKILRSIYFPILIVHYPTVLLSALGIVALFNEL